MQLEKLKEKVIDQFFEAILSLRNMEEGHQFFEDLCTLNEIQLITQRLEIAKLLKEGFTYQKIEMITGASTATISKVKRALNYGNGSLNLILERLNQEVKN